MTTTPTDPDTFDAARFTGRSRENFPVLSLVVPRELRAGFAAVYSFCRVSDDIADCPDRTPEQRLGDLGEWRAGLDRCFWGDADLPVYRSLAPVVRSHDLPIEPFYRLLDAFEADQRVTEHRTWDDLVAYSTLSANPVGELVLRLGGHRETDDGWVELLSLSDAVCTGLQLANFWQDVRRDLLGLGRVYLPEDETGLSAETLLQWSAHDLQGAKLPGYARILEPLVTRTRRLMERAEPLPGLVSPSLKRCVWLFRASGIHLLDRIAREGYRTLWQRPVVSKRALLLLTLRSMGSRAGARP